MKISNPGFLDRIQTREQFRAKCFQAMFFLILLAGFNGQDDRHLQTALVYPLFLILTCIRLSAGDTIKQKIYHAVGDTLAVTGLLATGVNTLTNHLPSIKYTLPIAVGLHGLYLAKNYINSRRQTPPPN
ncbi:hypothetical protein A2291_01450 [candidate division WOR-1 bacterium RIFOXYB2_FULL_42_35]|uniref:Uncharacterized protein n=1 Tax=candidate division WOR-1 bacterium RIFOXYC2_FULL_41_25 TaxID=1802586 RepID=A0A1F4TQM0_UNCSA|nr:MAG: hypothetical protein A2247_00770 [candidate division WOR-1 bacterium RIFOXYA2_FULL_41_14]OGC21510.1 MAG: hypothetical protein A2291_01450 [candidate division WOR-1 bacterium RIFOXYB2_FULL_42_35]OGC35015.1 MAG: hypothetical protein A2462_05420 [candidate division WOR-1 bacterium RIFOXYC2_FULL_41_25]